MKMTKTTMEGVGPIYARWISGAGALRTILLLITCLMANQLYSQLAGYGNRKLITINSSQVAGTADLTNFPLLVNFTSPTVPDLRTTSNGGSVTSSDGYDIAFTSSDGVTELDHEIELYVATTGAYIAWVRIPTLDYDDDTQIYMYYGNSSVTTDPSTAATWDSHYQAVWHLNEAVTAGGNTGTHLDATSNGRNAGQDGNEGVSSGQIGNCQLFDGGDDQISLPAPGSYTNLTLSIWINHNSIGNNVQRYLNLSDDFVLRFDGANSGTNNQVHFYVRDGVGTISSLREDDDLTTGAWFHIAGTYDGNDQYLYINGVEVETATPGFALGALATTHSLSAAAETMNGLLDEARVSNIALSADWIATEYNNQSSPGTFLTLTDTPLPIVLLGFEASTSASDQVSLTWRTATETDNEHFTIERSRDAKVWDELVTIAGAGTSTEPIDYRVIDDNPLPGLAYYRLKQTDFDGKFEYSGTVAAIAGEYDDVPLSVFPNPAQNRFVLTASPEALHHLRVADLAGRDVTSLIRIVKRTETAAELDISSLPTGTYNIWTSAGSAKLVKEAK